MPRYRVNQQATITAENVFTDWAELKGLADVSASGVSDSTVTVQRTFDGGVTVKDIQGFGIDFEKVIDATGQGALYRVGIKTGDYGTDTVVCSISQ